MEPVTAKRRDKRWIIGHTKITDDYLLKKKAPHVCFTYESGIFLGHVPVVCELYRQQ